MQYKIIGNFYKKYCNEDNQNYFDSEYISLNIITESIKIPLFWRGVKIQRIFDGVVSPLIESL
jgi:hypothetical protein